MYFDKDTGSWVRLPVGWELHHNMVKSLVDQVEVSDHPLLNSVSKGKALNLTSPSLAYVLLVSIHVYL